MAYFGTLGKHDDMIHLHQINKMGLNEDQWLIAMGFVHAHPHLIRLHEGVLQYQSAVTTDTWRRLPDPDLYRAYGIQYNGSALREQTQERLERGARA